MCIVFQVAFFLLHKHGLPFLSPSSFCLSCVLSPMHHFCVIQIYVCNCVLPYNVSANSFRRSFLCMALSVCASFLLCAICNRDGPRLSRLCVSSSFIEQNGSLQVCCCVPACCILSVPVYQACYHIIVNACCFHLLFALARPFFPGLVR